MVPSTLVLGAAFSAAVATLYGYVGIRLAGRPVSAGARAAHRAFVAWWIGLAAVSVVGAVATLAAAAGVTDLAFHLTLTHVLFVGLFASLGALLYYLLYVYTGRPGWTLPLTAAYGAMYGLTAYIVRHFQPQSVRIGRWRAEIVYAAQPDRLDPLVLTWMALLVVPPVVAALAYATLWFRVREPAKRWRIGLVSGSISIWFASGLVAYVADVGSTDAWQLASRFLGFGAASVILLAYFPPAWVRHRVDSAAVEEAL